MMKSIIERGRSMVEMLGTLAVIGVLSFVGLAGYNFAMKKHIQNELKNELAMRAIAVSSQMLAGQEPGLGSFPPEVRGYEMKLSAAPSASAFGTSDYLDEETNEPLNFTEVDDIHPEDKEFAIGIDGLPADLVEWFLGLVQQGGLIQRIVDTTGSPLSSGQDWQHAAVYSKTENKAGDTYNIYIIFASDLAQKKSDDLEEFVGSQCNGHGSYTYLPIYGAGCQCEGGYSGEKCSEKVEACSGQGVWYDGTIGKMCLCNTGKTGVKCEREAGNSPCQDEGSSEGKPCEQAGIAGRCRNRSCIASSQYYKCSTIDQECGEGYFCHYGDTESDIKTPNICEKVNADGFQVKGETYYVNTDKDLRSWCRAKSGKDCDWGFLAYEGAQSWCAGLEEEAHLLTKDELCSIKDRLPKVLANQKYWALEGKIVEITPSGCQEVSDKTAAAGVVCKKGSAIASALTAEERAFVDEMKKIKNTLSNLDEIRSKMAQLSEAKKKLKQQIEQKNGEVSDSVKAKYDLVLKVENRLNQEMVIFEKVYRMATEVEALAKNLTKENIRSIKTIQGEYESANYPEQLLKLWNLDNVISIKENKGTIAFKVGMIEQLLGIKTAYAESDPTGITGDIVDIVCPPVGIYDSAVGVSGIALDSLIYLITLGEVDVDICKDTSSWIQVSSNVNRIVNACGLTEVNHIHETILEALIEETVGKDREAKCGCPDGGTYNVVDNGDGTLSMGCCKDGYMYESLVKKYIRVSASVCGCPSGTEKKGKHCCNEHNYELETLYSSEKVTNTLEPSFFGCGCPDGGTLNPDCITRGVDCFCCKDGFVFDEVDKKYDDIIPDMCGCPAGGKRIDLPDGTYFEGYRGSVCCKNGKAFSEKSGDYTAVYAYCGCPDGGEQSKGEEALGTCCKNNYAFNDSTQKYDKFFLHACGCPNGGEEKVFENAVTTIRGCCKDGFKHSEIKDEYSVVDPVICGCPDGGTPNKPVTMTDERTVSLPVACCKNGKKYVEGQGYTVDTEVCCSTNQEWNGEKCVCPDEGILKSGHCCKVYLSGSSYIYDSDKDEYVPDTSNLCSDCTVWHRRKDGTVFCGECPYDQEDYNGTCCETDDMDCICEADPDSCRNLVNVTRQVQQGCDGNSSMWCLRT